MKLERILTKEVEKVILCYIYTQHTFLSLLVLLFYIELETLTMNERITRSCHQ